MSEYQRVELPKQSDTPAQSGASAPYNFVPLPEVVVRAVEDAEKLPDHSTYANQGFPHTGYFDVTLTVNSPVYVRCPLTRDEFDLDQQSRDRNGDPVDEQTPYPSRIKNTPHFFYTQTPDQPVIPGSSLRGMLRGLLEVVSYGKMRWVTDKKLFFRTFDITAVGDHYRDRMVGKVETGFLQQKGDQYVIKTCQMVRVPRQMLGNNLYEGRGPNMIPRWNGQPGQWMPVWTQLAAGGFTVGKLNFNSTPGCQEGRLVITGNMQDKKNEFVFLLPAQNAEEVQVSEGMLERFHDDDQITQWQQRAFPKDRPGPGSRNRAGWLRTDLRSHGDPVFFMRENGELTFFGRAQMFRLPYTQRPIDLVPSALAKPEDTDYADAMFGYVRTRGELEDMKQRSLITEIPKQGQKARAYSSRVFVTHATVVEASDGLWLSDDPFPPHILTTPKPTAFQHYLVQPNNNSRRFKHYDSPSPRETVLRGHKLYWRQGSRTRDDLTATPPPTRNSTQHTQFKPIKPGVKFQFRVHFENLSDRELGALAWVLHPLGEPSKDYCHQLGMGKPLGMGAVKLDATLRRIERTRRYSALFDARGGWETGETPAPLQLSNRNVLENLVREFEQHVLGELKPHPQCQHLFGMKRIAMLLKMMEWPGIDPKHASYMGPGEFGGRRVLPLPSAYGKLAGQSEPGLDIIPQQSGPANPLTLPPPDQEQRPPQGPRPRPNQTVTLLSDERQGKAQVRTAEGLPVECSGINSYFRLKAGQSIRVRVAYENGSPVSAQFRGRV